MAHQTLWNHAQFSTSETSTNMLSFVVYDLTDVRLGRFVVGLTGKQSIDRELFTSIHGIIREAVERFAVIAKPLTTEEGLEKIFAYINKHTSELLQPKHYRDLEALLVYANAHGIHFSVHGSIKLMLIRKRHIFDIIKMTYGTAPQDFDKLFTRMYSGDINPNDHLLLTSSETWDCFDTGRIPDVVAKLQVESAAGFLEQYLPTHSTYQLGGILIGITEPEQSTPKKTPPLSPAASIEELINTENRTKEMITPSATRRIKDNVALAGLIFEKINSITRTAYITTKKLLRISNRTKLQPIQHQPVITTKEHKNRKQIKTKPIWRSIIQSLQRLGGKIKATPETITYLLQRAVRLYRKWPKSTKYLFVVAIAIIIIFTQSIAYTERRNQAEEQATYFNQLVDDITRLQTQANQAIIFKDYARARSLLIEADNTIATLPSVAESENQKQELLTTNDALLARANRQTQIQETTTVTTISNTAIGLTKAGSTIVALSPTRLTRITGDNQVTDLELTQDLGVIRAIAFEDTTDSNSPLIVLHNQNEISQISTTDGTVTSMNTTIDVSGAVAAYMYTSRLYTLNPSTNQIIRYQKGTASFQAGQSWLEIPSDLSKAQDLAVDGTIFVLDALEGIIQFNQGVRGSFAAEVLDPPITTATRLITSETTDRIYLLDSSNARILLYDKQGDFLRQLVSPRIANAQDFVVDEATSAIYLLLPDSIETFAF